MATLEEAEDALDLINALQTRALEIVGKAPYWKFISEPEHATLDINDDEASLTWPESVGGWEGEHHIEWELATFPSSLLFLDADAFAAWKEHEHAEYKKREAAQQAQRKANAEAKERRVLAALQQKYNVSAECPQNVRRMTVSSRNVPSTAAGHVNENQ